MKNGNMLFKVRMNGNEWDIELNPNDSTTKAKQRIVAHYRSNIYNLPDDLIAIAYINAFMFADDLYNEDFSRQCKKLSLNSEHSLELKVVEHFKVIFNSRKLMLFNLKYNSYSLSLFLSEYDTLGSVKEIIFNKLKSENLLPVGVVDSDEITLSANKIECTSKDTTTLAAWYYVVYAGQPRAKISFVGSFPITVEIHKTRGVEPDDVKTHKIHDAEPDEQLSLL